MINNFDNTIKIIVDANIQIGMGHFMREYSLCRLAQKQKIEVVFYTISKLVFDSCNDFGLECFIYNNETDLISDISDQNNNVIVIDIHQKDFEKYRVLENKANNLILIISEVGYDFKPYGKYNFKVGSKMNEWSVEDEFIDNNNTVRIFSGRKWMIFRDEFENITDIKKSENKICIVHGGTDPYNLTELSVEILELTDLIYDVEVFVTSRFPYLENVKRICKESKHRIELIQDSSKLAVNLSKSTLVIINGGNVRYESCIIKTPFIAISFQPTQYVCTKELTDKGVGLNVGLYTEIDKKKIAFQIDELMSDKFKIKQMMKNMEGLFDLNGGQRILNLICKKS
jgi:spore coat polysaccharide biosynthesis predicted glycosyltransferase SpsG